MWIFISLPPKALKAINAYIRGYKELSRVLPHGFSLPPALPFVAVGVRKVSTGRLGSNNNGYTHHVTRIIKWHLD